MRSIAVIGVPSSAGAHWPGQENAPRALRDAGLIAELRRQGLTVRDLGDLPRERFAPDRRCRSARNVAAVTRVATSTMRAVEVALAADAQPLVIGGDCSIALGVTAALSARHDNLGLVYFDGHADLNTPATSPSGILDTMGLAHILGIDGTVPELTGIGPRCPLLNARDVAVFGANPTSMNPSEVADLARREIATWTLEAVHANPRRAAAEAIGAIGGHARPFSVHFDVDVVDFADLPLANVAQFGEGLPFDDAIAALAAFASAPGFAALTVAEVNPSHGDEEGEDLRRLVRAIAAVLSGSHAQPSG